MSERQRGFSSAQTSSVLGAVCPAGRQSGCPLRTVAVDVASGRTRSKDSLTECETQVFLSLARGHRIAVRDHEGGAFWRGWVDMTFPEHGFVWVITDFGERKLLDISVHTVWRPDETRTCGTVHRGAGTGTGHLESGPVAVKHGWSV